MPSLPTTNLTLHTDASDTDHIFTTFNGSGVHSGTPTDGSDVQAWDDEGDGIADVVWQFQVVPQWRSTTPLMLLPCIDFDGTEYYQLKTQTGAAAKALSDLITASAFTMLFAVYPESVTLSDPSPDSNHSILADGGGFFGVTLKLVSGVPKALVYNYDGAMDEVTATVTVNATNIIMVRHESGNLFISVNGGAESSVASGNTQTITGTVYLGTLVGFLNGRIGELATYNAALTGTTLSDAIQYFKDKWLGVTAPKASGGLLFMGVGN